MTNPQTLAEALTELRANRRMCEVLAATARAKKEYAQARYYNGKVDAYDVMEALIVAVRDARSYL